MYLPIVFAVDVVAVAVEQRVLAVTTEPTIASCPFS